MIAELMMLMINARIRAVCTDFKDCPSDQRNFAALCCVVLRPD